MYTRAVAFRVCVIAVPVDSCLLCSHIVQSVFNVNEGTPKEIVQTQTVCTLQLRHNGHDSVSNHQPHDCLLNHLFRRRSKKTSKLRVTGLCAVNSLGTGEFPAQMTSNVENVSIWWRHHDNYWNYRDIVQLLKTTGQEVYKLQRLSHILFAYSLPANIIVWSLPFILKFPFTQRIYVGILTIITSCFAGCRISMVWNGNRSRLCVLWPV